MHCQIFSVFLKSMILFSILSFKCEKSPNQSSVLNLIFLNVQLSNSLHKLDSLLLSFLSCLSQIISNLLLGSSICTSNFLEKYSITAIINTQESGAISFLSLFCLKYFIFSCFCFTGSVYSSTVSHIVSNYYSLATEIWPIQNRLYPCWRARDSVLCLHSEKHSYCLAWCSYLLSQIYCRYQSTYLFFYFFSLLCSGFQLLHSIVLKTYF